MMAMRTAKTGLYGGLALGFVQDAIRLAQGRHLRYVDFIKDTLGTGKGFEEEKET